MKQLIFIKPVHHIQIGHLYEHLYCDQLIRTLRDRGLFAYVDYNIDAKTYYAGYVYLEVFIYNENAIEIESLIRHFSPEIDQDAIAGGLLQIMAEKMVDVKDINYTTLTKTLKKYDAQPWGRLQNWRIEALRRTVQSSKTLSFVSQVPRNFATMTQSISVNLDEVSLESEKTRALFAVIADALRQNLQEDITSNTFCYSVSNAFTKKGALLSDVNVYRVDKRQAVALTSEFNVVDSLVRSMMEHGFVERLSNFLLTTDSTKVMTSPDPQALLEKVSIVAGDEGWHTIGTKENIQKVLSGITIQLKLGKSLKKRPLQ